MDEYSIHCQYSVLTMCCSCAEIYLLPKHVCYQYPKYVDRYMLDRTVALTSITFIGYFYFLNILFKASANSTIYLLFYSCVGDFFLATRPPSIDKHRHSIDSHCRIDSWLQLSCALWIKFLSLRALQNLFGCLDYSVLIYHRTKPDHWVLSYAWEP